MYKIRNRHSAEAVPSEARLRAEAKERRAQGTEAVSGRHPAKSSVSGAYSRERPQALVRMSGGEAVPPRVPPLII